MSILFYKIFLIPGLPQTPFRNGAGVYEGVVAHATANYGDTDEGERAWEARTLLGGTDHEDPDAYLAEWGKTWDNVAIGAEHPCKIFSESFNKILIRVMLIVVAALWAIGYILKNTPRVPDWTIVYILLAVSIAAAFFLLGPTEHEYIEIDIRIPAD